MSYGYVPGSVPVSDPNLFIDTSNRRFAELSARHQASDGKRSFFVENHICADGIGRAGIWIPLAWWEAPAQRATQQEQRG